MIVHTDIRVDEHHHKIILLTSSLRTIGMGRKSSGVSTTTITLHQLLSSLDNG